MKLWSKLPLAQSLASSGRAEHIEDLQAGLMTAVLLVPQGLAYAMLAGLPAELGLYACLLPPIVYALFGSSRTLSVGPVAVAALMVAEALREFAVGEPALWTAGAAILAAEVGLVLLLMRALGLGALSHFVSHPVLYGFTAGAALLILHSQLPHLLGTGGPLADLSLSALNPIALVFSALAIAALLIARGPLAGWLSRARLSAAGARQCARAMPLLLVLAAALVSAMLAGGGTAPLDTVGPLALSPPQPWTLLMEWSAWQALAPSAALIAIVAYVESIAVARVLAARRRQRIDPDQELTALGLANVAAAGLGTMPVAGGFSRSIVNYDAGARTQLASIIAAFGVAILLLVGADLLAYLPQAVLAAIIVVAVLQLIDLHAIRAVFAYDRGDGLTLLATTLGVLLFGIESGLVLGIVLSIALYLRQSSQPHLAVLGRVPGTEHFRNVERHQVECAPGVLILRVDANLYFANMVAVEDGAEAKLKACSDEPPRVLLLVMSAVSYIDTSAEEALLHWQASLAERGIELHLAEVKGPVWDRLRDSPLGQVLAQRVHLSIHRALEVLAGPG